MSREIKTGIVSLLIIALFIWGFNFLKGQNLFDGNSREFYIEYDNIQGLNKASIVTINGLQVGKVADITFNTKPEKRGSLVVKIIIDNDFEFSKNSIAKLYSTSLLGGEALAIIPNYEGDPAKSGDYLTGEVESDMISTVKESLNPLKAKLENVIIGADSLLIGLNQVLDESAKASLNRTIVGLETTLSNINKTITSTGSMIDSTGAELSATIKGAKKITDNMVKVSDSLANVNIGQTVTKLQSTLDNVNSLLTGIESGKGTLGKLAKDEALYNNLTNASKELEELLRDMKLNPKRFVHFSLFGKKAKPFNEENNKNNVSNK